MPTPATHLTIGGDSATGTSYQTDVINPTSGRLVLVAVSVSAAAAPTPAVSVSGCGLTWVQVTETAPIGVNALDSRTTHLFRARGNPTQGRLTITAASTATACTWEVAEFSGVDTSGTNGSGAIVQSLQYRTPNSAVTSVSRPFGSTVGAANGAFSSVVLASLQEALTPGTGWTTLGQTTIGGPQSSQLAMGASTAPQNVAASWPTAGNVSIVAVEIKAGAGDITAPTVPSNVTATANSSAQVTVAWTASTDATGVASYRVRRNGSDLPGATAVVGTSFADTTVTPGNAYAYTVSAVDAAGNRSAESTQASVTTTAGNTVLDKWDGAALTRVQVDRWDGTSLTEQVLDQTIDRTPPTVPTGLTATAVSSSQINLTWNPSTDTDGLLDGYVVRRNGQIIEGSVVGTDYSDTGLSGSTTYTYTVQAFDDSGNESAQSATAQATTSAVTDTSPPTTPTNLAASVISSNQINLTWTASTDNVGVARYIVLRNGTPVASNVTQTSFSSTGLAASTQYAYAVQAADAAGNVSAESASVTSTTQAVPTDPGSGGGTPTGDYVIGLTASQIQALPRSGTAWTNFKRQADGSYSLIYTEAQGGGNTDGSGNCVAGALMYVATGDNAYRQRVLAAVQAVENTNHGDWWHAAVNRKLGGWALAAHLIGHDTASWRDFLRTKLTFVHGSKKSSIMHKTAWQWDNNHGAAAQSSYAVICAILGLTGSNVSIGGTPGGIYHLNKWLRGWLGDHTSTGFPHVQNTNPPYGSMGITDPTLSNTWQDVPSNPYGVVPSTASTAAKRGAVPSDIIREGAAYPAIGGAAKHYVYGNAGRRSVAAVVLAAMGYPEIWEVGDFALYRWRKFCADTSIGLPEGASNQAFDPIIKKVYQNKSGFTTAAFTATSATSDILPATEWLALSPDWPVRRTSILP